MDLQLAIPGRFAQLKRGVLNLARRYSKELWALAIGFLVIHDIFGAHGVLAMRRTQKEASQIRQEIQRLDDENRKLQERVKALKTDPSAIESIARDMGLARPGEFIFKLPAKPGDPASKSSKPQTAPSN
jgi:cell division protein FtsB